MWKSVHEKIESTFALIFVLESKKIIYRIYIYIYIQNSPEIVHFSLKTNFIQIFTFLRLSYIHNSFFLNYIIFNLCITVFVKVNNIYLYVVCMKSCMKILSIYLFTFFQDWYFFIFLSWVYTWRTNSERERSLLSFSRCILQNKCE